MVQAMSLAAGAELAEQPCVFLNAAGCTPPRAIVFGPAAL